MSCHRKVSSTIYQVHIRDVRSNSRPQWAPLQQDIANARISVSAQSSLELHSVVSGISSAFSKQRVWAAIGFRCEGGGFHPLVRGDARSATGNIANGRRTIGFDTPDTSGQMVGFVFPGLSRHVRVGPNSLWRRGEADSSYTFGITENAVQLLLNGRFTYARDDGEYWRILPADGPVCGDCEDYSLTLVWLWEGRSLLRFWWALITFKYVFWHCLSPRGVGHLVVWCRGRGWTDNIQRKMVATLPDGYRLWFPYLFPLVALKFLLRSILGNR